MVKKWREGDNSRGRANEMILTSYINVKLIINATNAIYPFYHVCHLLFVLVICIGCHHSNSCPGCTWHYYPSRHYYCWDSTICPTSVKALLSVKSTSIRWGITICRRLHCPPRPHSIIHSHPHVHLVVDGVVDTHRTRDGSGSSSGEALLSVMPALPIFR